MLRVACTAAGYGWKKVRVERDKYGRLLAYVWFSPPEAAGETEVRAKMFNAELSLPVTPG